MAQLTVKEIHKTLTHIDTFYIHGAGMEETIWKKTTEIMNDEEKVIRDGVYYSAQTLHPEYTTPEEVHADLVKMLHGIEEAQKADIDPDDKFEVVITFEDDPDPDPRTFAVWEGHINDLMKKLHTIERKAQKYGCPISYKQVGETTKEIPTGETDPVTGKPTFVTCKFVLIQAEGTAVINDWEFVATVEHTSKGNIFSKALTDVEIPVRYRTTPCTCEHCNTKRIRSNTFIIRNTKTGDFKQIGRSCLKDYTGGLSAETAVWYASLKNVFEEYREPSLGGSFWFQRFYDTEEFLRYTAETIRHFGYRKSDTEQTTKGMVQDFFDLTHGNTRYWTTEDKDRVRDQMVKVGFNADSPEASQMVREALEWLDGQKDVNDYIHNLKTVTALPVNHSGRFGLLVSLFPTWNRDLEIQAERRKELEAGKASVFVGEVGDKIIIEAIRVRCITSWGYYPTTTYLWEIIGKDGNVYIWKTSKELDTDADHITLKGSVKDHREFRGVKQTEVTRCRIQGVA